MGYLRAVADAVLEEIGRRRGEVSDRELRDWLWTAPILLERFRMRGSAGPLADLWRERFGGDPDALHRALMDGISPSAAWPAYENLSPAERVEIQARLLRDARTARESGGPWKPNQRVLLSCLEGRLGVKLSPERRNP
jgi:hypothetical protein